MCSNSASEKAFWARLSVSAAMGEAPWLRYRSELTFRGRASWASARISGAASLVFTGTSTKPAAGTPRYAKVIIGLPLQPEAGLSVSHPAGCRASPNCPDNYTNRSFGWLSMLAITCTLHTMVITIAGDRSQLGGAPNDSGHFRHFRPFCPTNHAQAAAYQRAPRSRPDLRRGRTPAAVFRYLG